MLKFTSEADLLRLNPAHKAYPVIADLVDRIITESYKTEFPYDPDADGWIALVDQDDLDRPLTEFFGEPDPYHLIDIPYEGINRMNGMFVATYLANNQFGIVFVVPESIVHGELLDCFEAHLDE